MALPFLGWQYTPALTSTICTPSPLCRFPLAM
jgi:hypothetical protein